MKPFTSLCIFISLLGVACCGNIFGKASSSDDNAPAATKFDPSSIVFYLYTRLNPSIKTGQIIKFRNVDSLKNSNYNESNPTRFIVHGFKNNYKSTVNEVLVDAYLKNADFNVIVVDWGKGANLLLIQYSTARKNVPAAGERIGLFIDFLYNSTRNSTLDFHENTYIVGHSLGAHVAGFAGRSSQHGKPGVIVGLDPAGPEFDINKPMERLNNEDAKYVHVIHTNLHQVLFQLGLSDPIGDADFYPNYGLLQMGCMSVSSVPFEGTPKDDADVEATTVEATTDEVITDEVITDEVITDEVFTDDPDGPEIVPYGCNHDRSYYYFAESLESDNLIGALCSGGYYDDIKKEKCEETGDFLQFGGLYLKKGKGVYYFTTNRNFPFGRGNQDFATAKSIGI